MKKKSNIIIPDGVTVRYTQPSDGFHLKKWFEDKEGGKWFPLEGEMEIDDAVIRWIAFHRYQCSITIEKNGVPCGIGTLYLQPYKKLAHQCEFGIVVGNGFRGQGIGSYLLACLMHLAKEKFKIRVIHLQVYEGNPGIHLYNKFGFKEFARQEDWIQEMDGSQHARIFMERTL